MCLNGCQAQDSLSYGLLARALAAQRRGGRGERLGGFGFPRRRAAVRRGTAVERAPPNKKTQLLRGQMGVREEFSGSVGPR